MCICNGGIHMPTKKDKPKSTSKFYNRGFDEGYEKGRNDGFKEGTKRVESITINYIFSCIIEFIKDKFRGSK